MPSESQTSARTSDALGDRMKTYEAHECQRRFLPTLPIYARIDGRNFSAFTRGMERPYDQRMTDAMVATIKGLVEETHARIGYTQSDEISLVWLAAEDGGSVFFNGKVLKMASVLAGLATAHFMQAVRASGLGAEYEAKLPHFDCRVIQLPTKTEAANMFLWRELDATKNAVSMAARSLYSHKALHRKTGSEMQEMLFAKGVNFNDYPPFFKRGTFVRRVQVQRAFLPEELDRIPEKHRPTPETLVIRSEVRELTMPKFRTVVNREAVIFDGAEPETVSVMEMEMVS